MWSSARSRSARSAWPWPAPSPPRPASPACWPSASRGRWSPRSRCSRCRPSATCACGRTTRGRREAGTGGTFGRKPAMMGRMMTEPVNLGRALASFDEVYSPRIVTRMNDYDVRIAHAHGEHVWHVHNDTDEFFLVLDGRFDIALRDADGGERTVSLHTGDVFVVPKGTQHKPSSPGGAI